METYIVKTQIEIEAAARSVWKALTDPNYTEQYFFGCRVYSNWTPGGRIVYKRMFLWIFPFELRGEIISIIPGAMVRYTLRNSKTPTESIVTLELAYQSQTGKTIVAVTDDVGQGEGARNRYNRSVKGWDKILKGLKHTVERELKR